MTGRKHAESTLDDFLVLKFDATDGHLLWEYILDGPSHLEDAGWGIAADASGGCTATGVSFDLAGEASFTTVRLDSDGNQVWLRYEPGALQNITRAGWIGLDDSGDAIMANRQWVDGESFNVFLRRYAAADGATVWASGYDSPGHGADDMRHMALGSDGHPLVTGVSSGDFMTLKFDRATGALIWDTFYDGPSGYYDLANSLLPGPGGEVYVTGFSDGGVGGWDAFVQALDSGGNELWTLRYDGPDQLTDEGQSLALSNLGDFYLCGYSYDYDTDMDQLAVRYSLDTTGLPLFAVESPVSAWPNPFHESATIRFDSYRSGVVEVEIFDVTGRRVRRLVGEGQLLWDGRDQSGRRTPAGVYLARLRGGGQSGATRLIRVD